MDSTRLFCNDPLGRNAQIEHPPVGRRRAFDPAKARPQPRSVTSRFETWTRSLGPP